MSVVAKIEEVLALMHQNDVEVWLDQGQIRYKAFGGQLSQDLRDLLVANKQSLIDYLQAQKEDAGDVDGPVAASYIQRQLYFLDSLDDGGYHYNIPFLYKITGKLDVEGFLCAINTVINRHDALRTRFAEQDGQVYQVVGSDVTCASDFVDYSEIGEGDELNAIVRETHYKAFNLKEEDLYSLKLIQTEVDVFYFCGCFHHIIVDGVSLDQWMKELLSSYKDLCSGLPVDASKSETQYTDYSRWQSKLLNSREISSQIKYWQETLKGMEPLIQLPLDKARQSAQTYRGKTHSIVLSTDLKTSIDDFIRTKPGITYFSFFLTVYFVLLKRYTTQQDLTVGIPVSNKRLEKFENVLGMFVHSLPTRNSIENQDDFSSILQRVSDSVFSAYENQDVPLEKIIEVLQVKRDPAYSPIFQTMFYMSEQPETLQCADLTIRRMESDLNIAKFDLTLSVAMGEAEASCGFEYNTDLFEADTIARFAEHFCHLVENILENPNEEIGKLDILSDDEKHFLIHDVNDNESDFESSIQIQTLFERFVEKTPEAPAVSCEDAVWSYRELNEKANQIAHFLKKHNVLPNQCVGVLMERSNEVLSVLLGILKTGATFVPMDPEYPNTRLEYIIKDAAIEVVFSQASLAGKVAGHVNEVICLDKASKLIEKYSAKNLGQIADMSDLAYIIYTSGSTGNPKGVMIPHLGATHYMQWATRHYDCAKGSGAPIHSSLAFDLTITSLFCPLCCGKTVFMMPDALGFEGLLKALKDRQDYSLIKITPAHLKLLQTHLSEEILQKLFATIVIGGEALYYDALSFWHQKSRKLRFINEYGATETSVADTIYEVPAVPPQTTSLPVGKAIDNSQMFVLDEYLQPVPIGVIGEIYLGGVGLARGYLNRPELTEKKFLPNPFPEFPYEKMYKTGDLGKILPSGDVEFMGRIDNQVKIRGFRVELDEIQNVLKGLAGIKDVVVGTYSDAKNERCVAAYLLLHEKEIDLHQLRETLRKLLPAYMVPSAFVILESIPLTINGKVDVKALPEPDQDVSQLKAEYVAPETDLEKQLASIWSSVLGVDQIGRSDNFFALGGDSIMSLQVIAKARGQGLRLTTKQLFIHQTIAELGPLLRAHQGNDSVGQEARGDLLLTPIQSWFFERKFSSANHFNQAFLFRVPQDLQFERIERAFQALTAAHSSLRLRFVQQPDGCWTQSYQEGIEDCCVVEKRILNNGQSLEDVANSIHSRLDITEGPVLRCVFVEGHQDGYPRVLVVAHHLVIDGVSWRVLLEDLQKLLEGKNLGHSSDNYKTWSTQLHDYAKQKDFSVERQYWAKQNFCETDNFPLRTNGLVRSISGRAQRKHFELTEEQTERLLKLPYGAYRLRIHEMLMIALVLAVKKQYGQNGLLLALESHGREGCVENVDVSRTMGWFTSYYPVDFSLPNRLKDLCFDQFSENDYTVLCAHMKAKIRSVPDNGIAFGLMRYAKEYVDADSLFDLDKVNLSFNYLGQFDQSIIPGWEEDTEHVGQSIAANNDVITHTGINCWITNNKLVFEVHYSPETVSEDQIETYCDNFLQVQERLLSHCQSISQSVYMASDFDVQDITQSDVDVIIKNREIENIIHTSPYQDEMIAHTIKQLDCDAYFTQVVWACDEPLDIFRFKQAWLAAIKRYPALRTSFFSGELECYQVIHADASLDWHEHVWAHDATEAQLKQFLEKDREKGFDIFSDVPMRFHYIIMPSKVVFVWSHHHILLDGWSLPIIFQTLNKAYAQEQSGADEKACDLFQRYVQWQKNISHDEANAFWKREFSGLKQPSLLSQNYKVGLHGANRSTAMVSHTLRGKKASKLKTFMANKHYTENCLFQFAWACTLSQYLKIDTVVFAVMNAGRQAEFDGFDSVVGLCANALPFCLKFVSQDTPNSLLPRINAKNQELSDYASYAGMSKLCDMHWSQVSAPLDTFFVYENYPDAVGGEAQQMLMPFQALQFHVKMNFPMTVVIIPSANQYEVHFVYDETLFSEGGVKSIMDMFLSNIEHMVMNEGMEMPNGVMLANSHDLALLEDLVVPYRVGAGSTPWFMVHPGAAGAEAYQGLVEALPAELDIYALDSYHLKFNAGERDSIKDLASLYVAALQNIYPKGPVFLGGWSLGGLLAYEMAIQLEKAGRKVLHVMLLDTHVFEEKMGAKKLALQHVADAQMRASSMLKALPNDYQEHVLSVSRQESKMIAEYRPEPYHGEITLAKACAVPDPATFRDLSEGEQYGDFIASITAREYNGWDAYVDGVKVMPVQSDHWNILSGDALSQVVNVMRSVK